MGHEKLTVWFPATKVKVDRPAVISEFEFDIARLFCCAFGTRMYDISSKFGFCLVKIRIAKSKG